MQDLVAGQGLSFFSFFFSFFFFVSSMVGSGRIASHATALLFRCIAKKKKLNYERYRAESAIPNLEG